MNYSHLRTSLMLALLLAFAGCDSQKTTVSGDRKALFYQSPMHPWIRSDAPGNCTICGMKLVPIFEARTATQVESSLVVLPENGVTVLHVKTEPAQRKAVTRTLKVAGVIDDDATRHRVISAGIEGRIEKLFVNYDGAEVQEGQPLARIYSPELNALLREYRVQIQNQGGKALLDSLALRFEKIGLSAKQIADIPKWVESADGVDIISPQTGTVIVRDVYEGQTVAAGARLFEIGDFSTMWFVFDLYERDLGMVNVGQMVKVTLAANPGEALEAPVTFIDPNLNVMTRSLKVRVELPNPDRKLLHRLYAEGTIEVVGQEKLAVPRSAVLWKGNQARVFVDEGGGAYAMREVKLGKAGDTDWEVESGLDEGEPVVVQGNLMIDAQAEMQSAMGSGL